MKPEKNTSKIVILGAGGHGRVVADILCAQISAGSNNVFAGFVDENLPLGHQVSPSRKHWRVIGRDKDLQTLKAEGVDGFCVGIGVLRGSETIRQRIFNAACDAGLQPAVLIHPRAIVAPDVTIGAGTVVMAGAVVNIGSTIGENCIINTGAVLDHDAHIHDHVHIAPGCVLSGHVTVQSGTIVGVGSTVIQGISIGTGATVGAGSVVVKPVKDLSVVMGVPARSSRQS